MRTDAWRWALALGFVLALAICDFALVRESSAQEKQQQVQETGLPLDFGDWKGKELTVDPRNYDPTRIAVIQREYRTAKGERIDASMIYADKYEGLHKRERCMTGAGWSIVRHATVDMTYGPSKTPIRANYMVYFHEPIWRTEVYVFADADTVSSTWVEQFQERGLRRSGGKATCMLIVGSEIKKEELDKPRELAGRFLAEFLPYVQKSLQGP
jgi:hypothetical protein